MSTNQPVKITRCRIYYVSHYSPHRRCKTLFRISRHARQRVVNSKGAKAGNLKFFHATTASDKRDYHVDPLLRCSQNREYVWSFDCWYASRKLEMSPCLSEHALTK